MKTAFLFFLLALNGVVFGQVWNNSGPEGGFFKDFVIHPTNSQIIYAGSDDGGGVWKTIDGGETWELLTTDYPNFTGWHIEMDKMHPDTLYFCELYGRYGILKTTDGGESFTHLTEGFTLNRDLQTTQLAIYSQSSDTLFASTGEGDSYGRIGNGVFKSVNGGINWSYSGLQDTSIHCIRISNTNRIFAGTENYGLKYSDNSGETWLTHPDIPDTATVLQIDKKENILVVSAAANGVFISYDNGNTFTYSGLYGEFNFDLKILKTSPYLEIISTGFFHPNRYTSETGEWTAIVDPLLNDQLLIGIDAVEDIIYIGIFSSAQIIRSVDNGETWEKLANNPVATEIRAIVVDPDSDRIYTSLQNSYNLGGNRYNTESICVSTDGGLNWERTGPIAHGMDLEMHPSNSEIIFLGTFAQGLFKTSNGFASWENSRVGNKLILDVAINPTNPTELLLSELDIPLVETGVFKSTNGGDSWYQTGNLTATKILYNPINNKVYFSTENGIYISNDNGETISSDPVFFGGEVVLSMAYRNSYLYVGLEEGQLYKIDADDNITAITGDWNIDFPTEVRNILCSQNSIIVGLNGAEQDTLHNLNGSVWQSINNGETWTEITGNLTNTNIFGNTGIALSNDNQLFIATYGQGVFKSTDLVLDLPTIQKNTFSIAVYPNPAKNIITVKTDSQTNMEKITITSLDGKMVYKKEQINSNKFEINNLNLVAGQYLVTVIINGTVNSSKILIL